MRKWKLVALLVFVGVSALAQVYDSPQGRQRINVETGTVTANAGTNLNTSALALDATLTGRFPAGANPADNESNTSSQSRVGAYLFCFDGSTWDRCPGTTVDGLLVNLGANNDVTILANSTIDLNRISGAALSATNPAPARLTDGTAFYDARGITSFPDNEPFNVAQRGGSAIVADPCMREARIPISINQVAGTQLVTGTASERIFICSFHVITATAQNVALVSGTGTVCATSPSGVVGFGGSTAATGWNYAANGGIQMASSEWSYGKTDTDADNLCLLQSGAGQLSGGFTYVSAANF